MSEKTQAAAIIPVRVGSQRLPGKALLADSGQPLFLHTCQAASAARNIDLLCVATDDADVAAAADAAGIAVIRTSDRPRTGSERCAEAAVGLSAQVILDVQGDWPEIDPRDLEAMVEQLRTGEARCNTLAAPLTDPERAADPNVVKVVRGLRGDALYFSRAAIPHTARPDRRQPSMLRHIGVYGFDRETLLRVPSLPSSGLAETEGLEQLRFLENDITMQVLDAHGDPWGIETRADYAAFLARLPSQT